MQPPGFTGSVGPQVLEKRAAQLEKQLARLCAALGPAAVAAVVEASENGSETGALAFHVSIESRDLDG